MSELASRFDETPVAQDERLRALASYGPMDATPEAVLDGLVQLAARLCEAPIGLITLVDHARQLFKAGTGYEGPRTAPLEAGFCPIVVEQGEPVVIPDTLADPAHAGNVAARDGGVRFYAGVPLLADGAHVLGTLCVLDTAPRPAGLTQAQLDVLLTLSTQVVSQFELRRSLAQRDTLLAEQRAGILERDALARVQSAITAADGDLDTILSALVCNAMDAVPAANGGVLELIDGDVLEYRAVHGTLERHKGLRVPLRGSLAGSCAGTNQPALVDDVRSDGRAVRELIEPLHLRAAVLAPVARGGQVLGVLKLQSSEPGAFGPRDLEVVRLFAGVATAGLTEVRAAEAQKGLLDGARRQQAIFDSAVDFAIIATDRDGRVTDWNVGAERVMGWTPDEMRGDTVERIFTPEDRAIDRAGTEMRIALERGRASDERWHLRHDASRFWASGEMMPLRDGQDQHIGFLKILRDRTAEHEAGKALREAEADLQRAQVAGGVGIFTVPVSDNILKVTPEFCRIFGLPVRERMSPEEVERLVLPEDAHLASNTAKRADGEMPLDVEYRIRRADTGAIRWLSRQSEIERDRTGTAVRFFGVVRDITDQRANLDALARSEKLARENVQRVQLALEAGAIIGTWFWDLPTDRFTIDEAFATTFGLDPALGRDSIPLAQIVATVHPDDQAGLAEAINEAIGRGGRYAHQYRVRRHDGQYYWIEANGHVEHAQDGTPLRFPGVLLDIEERRAVEVERERATAELRTLSDTLEMRVAERTSELMQAEEALRQSQKMEAIGQLTGGVAHDFNNLLTVIKSASHMLQRPGITEERRTRYVDAISDTVDRAAKLTGQLLAFARRQALKPEVFAACDGVRGLADMLGTLTGSRVRVVTELPESRCFVNADASQFETALVNLAVNARDAMEGEGRITVTVKAIDALPSIRAHEAVLGRHVAISVADTGTGIPADLIDRIFEPFFTTKEIGKGTGLGLSQVFGFAKQSGGDVAVTSTVGQGTTFTIYLPEAAAPERDKVEQEPDALVDGQGLHVLVVEDNVDVGTFAQGTLNDLGYATVLATDGPAALAELARNPDRFDVVFSDVMMPGMSGIELAQEIRRLYRHLPVVLTSGYSQVLAQDGTHGFELLQKPYSIDQLSRMLRKVASWQRQARSLNS